MAQKLIKARRSCSLSMQEVRGAQGSGEGYGLQLAQSFHSITHTHTESTWLHLSIHQSIISGIVHQCHSCVFVLLLALALLDRPGPAQPGPAACLGLCCLLLCLCWALPILLRFCLAHRRIRRILAYKWAWPSRQGRKFGAKKGKKVSKSKSRRHTGRMIYF